MTAVRTAAFVCALIPMATFAAGFARNENFVVYSPDQATKTETQRFAELVLDRAEGFRREFAMQWLGEELPQGSGRSVIYIDFSTAEDRGLTWANDHPDRQFHNIFLTTTPGNAAGSTLRHELVHTVLATKYPHPNRLPPWLEEGIASRYDDEARHASRAQIVRFWVRTGRAVQLTDVLSMSDMRSFDESSYAAATSLVDFLLSHGDETKLVQMAEAGSRIGWDGALSTYYGISNQEELQTQWQAWIANEVDAARSSR